MELKKYILKEFRSQLPIFISQKKKELNHWKEYNKDNKKIIVFGAAGMGELCSSYFEKFGIRIDFFCDNNANMQGQFITDNGNRIPVVPVEELEKFDKNILCFVAAGSQHFKEISTQLEKYKLEEVVFIPRLDFYLEAMDIACNWSEETIYNKVSDLLKLVEDEESLKIILCHLVKNFELEIDSEYSSDFIDFYQEVQYFLEEGKYLNPQESIVDCGAFTGDTLADLMQTIGYETFLSYDCYELDSNNFLVLEDFISGLSVELKSKVFLHQCGIGGKEEEISYDLNKEGSTVRKNGLMRGRLTTLDKEFQDKKITFLKMDIEGSEQAALFGGQNVIRRDKPQCAICVYHSIRDLWEIPIILKTYVPEYQFILRHHTEGWMGTVCYAKQGKL